MKFYILTLGCPKNEVDSDGMQQVLVNAGHEAVMEPAAADALIVNTCGFIDQAKNESIAELKRLGTLKRRTARRAVPSGASRSARGKLLIAAGCLGQRYAEELARQVPELDGILGTLRWGEIADLLVEADEGARPCWTGEQRGETATHRVTDLPSAYLKISDGCNAPCAFCAIPRIKGRQRSRSIDGILAEAVTLAASGAKEIVLVAQDTTAYGQDLGMQDGLAQLLEQLVAEVPGVPWLRIMYAYPAHVTERLALVMAEHAQIVKYLDIPLQHGHPEVLRRMLRPLNGQQVITRLRETMPEIALRTALIVGYPGETEAEFRGLMEFLEQMRFDRVGVFTYSEEEGTKAAALGMAVPPKVKHRRYERAMAAQQKISAALNQALVGRELDVLIEGGGEGQGSVGRSFRDAPEVDGLVFVKEWRPPGSLVKVRITGAMEYDLVGCVVGTPGKPTVQ